ncbi:MAG: primase-helicase family protein [Lutibacter sp.]
MKKNDENSQFWGYEEGKPKISHTGLIYFLEENGFMRLKLNEINYVLVKKRNNRLVETSVGEIVIFIKKYLMKLKVLDVYEVFAKGLGSYVSIFKLNLLALENLPNDRDDKFSSNFYFDNCYCNVTKEGINVLSYDNLPKVIWEKRVIKKDYLKSEKGRIGQFEIFCRHITKESVERLLALKTIIGFLLHRNREFGEMKAVILYDENMSFNNLANGGTGKTLLSKAIGILRDVESFDGKEIKNGSWFKNQRINLTTDVIVYDDLNKDINLESFYSIITSGIEVEQKRKQAYFIEFEDSPKIMITSNYPVKGPGGSSDIRRRHEFEIANYYDADFTPEMDFGNRFFDNYWGQEEWSSFFNFMMSCVQEYLKNGLLNAPEINLRRGKMIGNSCEEFIEFANNMIVLNEWIDKRKFQNDFEEKYVNTDRVSSHIFNKWIDNYAKSIGGTYETKSTGGDYIFIIKKKEDENE